MLTTKRVQAFNDMVAEQLKSAISRDFPRDYYRSVEGSRAPHFGLLRHYALTLPPSLLWKSVQRHRKEEGAAEERRVFTTYLLSAQGKVEEGSAPLDGRDVLDDFLENEGADPRYADANREQPYSVCILFNGFGKLHQLNVKSCSYLAIYWPS